MIDFNYELIGELIKQRFNTFKLGVEVYGFVQSLDKKIVAFVIEREYTETFDVNDLKIKKHYRLSGELSEMDDSLWKTFDGVFPWDKPDKILFVKEIKSAQTIEDIFIF